MFGTGDYNLRNRWFKTKCVRVCPGPSNTKSCPVPCNWIFTEFRLVRRVFGEGGVVVPVGGGEEEVAE